MDSKAKNVTYLSIVNRTNNKGLYYVIDKIDEAIENDLKIEIKQFSIKPDGSKCMWSSKVVDPYFVVSDQSRYYLLCNSNRDGELYSEPRRIDRIHDVTILNEKRTSLSDTVGRNFNLSDYMHEHIYMFSGETGYV